MHLHFTVLTGRDAFWKQCDRTGTLPSEMFQQGEIILITDAEYFSNPSTRTLLGKNPCKERTGSLALERDILQGERP